MRKLPFTLLLLGAVVTAGVATGAAVRPLNEAAAARYGFALHDVWDGTWISILTSTVFTNRPLMFWGILPFVAASVGVLEWRHGTRRAAVVFLATDLGINILATAFLVLPLYALGTPLGRELAYADEVGMSVGGFGALGAWMAGLPQRARSPVVALVLLYLVVRLGVFTQLYTDVTHLGAFLAGVVMERRAGRPNRAQGSTSTA